MAPLFGMAEVSQLLSVLETIHELVRSGEYRHAFGVAKLDD